MAICGQSMTDPTRHNASLRECRDTLQVTQRGLAERLGVAPETYRAWESGRRVVPGRILDQARALAGYPDERALLPLAQVAEITGVHVRTLRAAARDGRLPVVYETRTTFRQLRGRSTVGQALEFRRAWFGKHMPLHRRPPAMKWTAIPPDFDVQIRTGRLRLGLSQRGFATRIGAAGKAVVYQWEARKRCPSPVFWERINALLRQT